MTVQENKLINYLAITLCCSVCFQRISATIGNVSFIIALLIFFYLLFQRRKAGVPIFQVDDGVKGYYKAFGIFIISLLPSALFTGDALGGMGFVLDKWIYRWLPFFAITLFIRDKQTLLKMLAIYAIAMGLDCLVALGQSLILDKYRPWGFSGHPMSLAMILCFVSPIFMVAVLDKRFQGTLKTIMTISLICCLIGVLVGNSRGAWLTLLFVLPVISWTYIKNNKKYMCVAGIICCLIAGIFVSNSTYQQRLISITNTTTDRSNADRILVWESARAMIQDHPIVGVGPGKFKEIYDKQYKSPEVTQDLQHSHNNFVQIATEFGLIGLSGFLYFIIYLIKRNYYELQFGNVYARMCLGCLLGFFLFGMIDYTLKWVVVNRLFGFLLAILLMLEVADKKNQDRM